MRRFLLGLMIVLMIIVVILWVLLFLREQNYYQLVADYTQFSSAADLQTDLNAKLEVGESTEADVVSFIKQSGIASKIDPNSNCGLGQEENIVIICKVRAPVTDYSHEFWMNQIKNLALEYYYIIFEFKDNKLKRVAVGFQSSWN